MTKYILIGGQIQKAPDGGRSFCKELVKEANNTPIRILDCLFARSIEDWEERFEKDIDFFSEYLESFELIRAEPEKFIEQLKNSDILFFQGGSPHKLISILDSVGDWKKELRGKVVVGSSGGADALCVYYGVGKTMNIGEGLGILPVKFIPHWKSNYHPEINIDWDLLLENLKDYKEDLSLVTLKEGEFKVFN